MNTYTDCAVIFFIMVAIITFDSVITLLSIFKDGILKNKRDILLEKTNKELKSMLPGANVLYLDFLLFKTLLNWSSRNYLLVCPGSKLACLAVFFLD